MDEWYNWRFGVEEVKGGGGEVDDMGICWFTALAEYRASFDFHFRDLRQEIAFLSHSLLFNTHIFALPPRFHSAAILATGPEIAQSHTHPLSLSTFLPQNTTNQPPKMSDSQLYEDTFTITSLNARNDGSQKYDRVLRITATSADQTTTATLDVNHELFPVNTNDTFQLVLASTLNLDGTKDDKVGWRDTNESTLADMYDYVCYGKVYRFEAGKSADNL